MIVNFTTRGATIVYQYQRLPNVHSTIAYTFSFPAGLLNKPSGCELYFIAGSRIMWYFGVQSRNLFPLGNRDNWVFKKAPRISHLFWVGQLAVANIDYRPTYGFNTQFLYAHFFQLGGNGTVFYLKVGVFEELKSNRYDDIFVFQLSLKNALAIPKFTFFTIEILHLTGLHIKCFQTMKPVLNFYTVRTNILHGTGPHIARYKR